MTDEDVERALLSAFERVVGYTPPASESRASTVDTDEAAQTLQLTRDFETVAQWARELQASGEGGGGGQAVRPPSVQEAGTSSTGSSAAALARTALSFLSAQQPNASTKSGSKVISTILKAGFGTVPVARLIAGLFGGSEPKKPPPLVRYSLPPAIRMEAANPRSTTNGRLDLTETDYGQDGLSRSVRGQEPRPGNSNEPHSPTREAGDIRGSGNMAPQILVNVQAMDSRSFLDHSHDIARAVRDAMLNMDALNDVVSEL
jgi:hypothetical protein